MFMDISHYLCGIKASKLLGVFVADEYSLISHMSIICTIHYIWNLHTPCFIGLFEFCISFCGRYMKKRTFIFSPFYIMTSPYNLKLFRIIFIKKCHWHPHESTIIFRYICYLTDLYCIIIVITRIFLRRITTY